MKSKLSKREKALEIELAYKDSSNIGLIPEERGHLALKLRFGGKIEAEKILQLIRQKAIYPYTYLKVRNLNKLNLYYLHFLLNMSSEILYFLKLNLIFVDPVPIQFSKYQNFLFKEYLFW